MTTTLELYLRETALEADLTGLSADVKTRTGVWGIFKRTYFHFDPPQHDVYLVVHYANIVEATKKATHQPNLMAVIRDGVVMIERRAIGKGE